MKNMTTFEIKQLLKKNFYAVDPCHSLAPAVTIVFWETVKFWMQHDIRNKYNDNVPPGLIDRAYAETDKFHEWCKGCDWYKDMEKQYDSIGKKAPA